MGKLTSRTALTTPASSDVLHIVDVSDTTDSPQGTSKKITYANLLTGVMLGTIVTTISTQAAYTVTELSGRTIKKVWYGEQAISSTYYTLVGTTFTLVGVTPIDAGIEIFILYV